MARLGLLTELRSLLAPSTSLQEVTRFLRLHAKELQRKQGAELLQEPEFRHIHARVQEALPSLDGQAMCSFLYWARSSFESTALSRIEALPNIATVEARVAELCASGAFRTRQLIPLLRDMRALYLNCTALETLLEGLLAKDYEQFSPEGLRQLLYVLACLESGLMQTTLLTRALDRWSQLSLDTVHIGMIAGTCADLLRLSRFIRLPAVDRALWSAAEQLIARAEHLQESDLHYLVPSLSLALFVPSDLLSAVLKQASRLNLGYQTRLALLALQQKPHFRPLMPPQLLQSLLSSLIADLPRMTTESFEGVLRSLLGCVPLPEVLHHEVKSMCEQKASPAFLLQWAMFEPDFETYVNQHHSALFNVQWSLPLRELMLTQLLVGTRTELPSFLKATLRYFDQVIASKIKQHTLACAHTFLVMEGLYPEEVTRFRPHYKALVDQLVFYLPESPVTILRFLYHRAREFPFEVQKVIQTHSNVFTQTDLQSLFQQLPITNQLHDICFFLNFLRPLLSITTLSQALKFEFQEIPPLYTELLMSVPGKLTSNLHFLELSGRLFAVSTLPDSLLSRLAAELESPITASEPVLRIAAVLMEKGFISDQAREKMEWLAQLQNLSPSYRILQQPGRFSGALSLDAVVDCIALAGKDASCLQPALNYLGELPLKHALEVFEKYSVTDTGDEVTQEILSALWPRVQSATPEFKLQFLKTASVVQWGDPAQLSDALESVLRHYDWLQYESKQVLVKVLGQLVYQGPLWTQITNDLTRTSEDMRRNGPLLLHSLHQARYGVASPWSCVVQTLRKPERLSGLELRQFLVAIISKRHQFQPEVLGRLVTQVNFHPETDFLSLLLHNYFLRYPSPVPFLTSRPVAEVFLNHPLVRKTSSELPPHQKDVVLEGGFLVPYYFPTERRGLWITRRAVSRLNGKLLGDFALYTQLGRPSVHLTFQST